jgi:nicotinamidase-related amidase
VLQTALDLLEAGYRLFPVADAISSRHPQDRTLGLERMRQSGAVLVSTEMYLFELLRTAQAPQFKTLQSLIK